MPQKLYLIPNTISNDYSTISSSVSAAISSVRYFFVEEEKSARIFLKKVCSSIPIDQCTFCLLNEHTSFEKAESYLKEAQGRDMGIISEAGVPCVADPGSDVVRLAHTQGIEVIPLVGPSSILLALMASGLNGQNFAFNGYLPKEQENRLIKIKTLEKKSLSENQTQIFMEAPYRNQHVLEDILTSCDPSTLLCVACDLASPTQYIKTLPVKEWKRVKVELNKRPVIFLLYKDKAR